MFLVGWFMKFNIAVFLSKGLMEGYAILVFLHFFSIGTNILKFRVFTQATFDCLMKTYGFLTPDFWEETRFVKSPFQEYTDLLAKPTSKIVQAVEEVEA